MVYYNSNNNACEEWAMAFFELKCGKCGGELKQKGDYFECGYCHSTYASDNVQKEREMMSQLFDEQKQEQIASIRHMLWEEIHAEYIDSEKIIELCISLQKIKPDDFEARFFEVANGGNGRQLNAFLDGVNVQNPEENFWTEEIVKFMIKSLRAENLLSLNDLIERAYKNTNLEKYEKYATQVSDEAKKVEGGIYESELPRDVFVMYSSKDFEKVKELVYTLEESGLKCFVAMRNLQHGRGAVANYQKALETAMDNCKIIVFLSSKNSRSLMCDAVKVEIPYLRKKDIMNAPYEYRLNYEQMPLKYKKPRVEYRLDNEGKGGGDMLVREFFGSLEYTYSAEEVLARVIKYLTQGVEDPEKMQPTEKYCLACGAKNPLKTKFCMECGGREFAETEEAYEQKKHDKDREALEKAEREKQELLARLQRMEEAQKEAEKRHAEEETKRKADEAERVNRELLERLKKLEEAQNQVKEAPQKMPNKAPMVETKENNAAKRADYFEVYVKDFKDRKLETMKGVKEETSFGLVDCKNLIERHEVFKRALTKEEAEAVQTKFNGFGVEIGLRADSRALAEIEADRKKEAERRQKAEEQKEKMAREAETEKQRAEEKRRQALEEAEKRKAEEEAKRREEEAIVEQGGFVRRGNKILFGLYPQSKAVPKSIGQTVNGYVDGGDGLYEAVGNGYYKVAPIEWNILEEKDGVALLLSEKVLDVGQFDSSPSNNRYEKSGVRNWLNGKFLPKAFSAEAKKRIITTSVDNSAASTCEANNPYAGKNTEDKIFLMSHAEMINKAYGFADSRWTQDKARQKVSTPYAAAKGSPVA